MRIAPSVNLKNLDTLAFPFRGQNQSPQVGWAIYAEPVDHADPLGPVRQVGDSDEGFSCVDDVARVALVYLEQFEKTGQPLYADKATQAIRFCLNQEDGQGHFFNFVERDGTINKEGHTSKPGLNWWSARAFWALGRAQRVLSDPNLREQIGEARGRTLDRLEEARDRAEIPPQLSQAYAELGVRPGTLVDHSGSITSIFALGLLEQLDPRSKSLLGDYCEAMQKLEVGQSQPLLQGLHLNSVSDQTTVHLYGNHQAQVLAEAGVRLGRPDWVASARAEADACARILASQQLPFAYSPAPEPGPQIAYAAETTIANLQAVYRATGEERYSDLAGLYATWFSGANVATKPVYHPPSGRAFDGVDPQGVSINSGAESNVETQLALSALEGSPGQRWLDFGQVKSVQGERLFVGDDFKVASGAPLLQGRVLNGGAVRPNWTLGDSDRVNISTGSDPSLLVWRSNGGPLQLDPDGPGPLPCQTFQSSNSGWQTTPVPRNGQLELGGRVTIDSLVERPALLQRRWSNGQAEVGLQVDATGWRLLN